MISLTTWCVLVLTLPTENATARMRFWRALKAKGCASIRDGVYLLPATDAREGAMGELALGIIEAGGNAYLLRAPSRDAAQDAEFRALFDRSGEYAAFARTLADHRKSLSRLAPVEITRLVRRLRKDLDGVRAVDYFPTDAAAQAEVAWQDFLAIADTVTSPGEPHAGDATIPNRRRTDFAERTWATRERLWVDRVASAWLIRRFIDPRATFIWLASPRTCPPDALGFDFDGAAFSHVGDLVTFEVLLTSFGLDDPGLVRLGKLVHALDVGGDVVPEAAGFEAILAGARQRCANDTALLDAMSGVLDALHLHFSSDSGQAQGG